MKKHQKTIWGGIVSAVLLAVLELVIPDRLVDIALITLAVLLPIGLALVIWGTAVKNRWGVNLEAVDCARCHMRVPQIRKPRSFRQMLWGGAICVRCGCEMDKWGRPVTT